MLFDFNRLAPAGERRNDKVKGQKQDSGAVCRENGLHVPSAARRKRDEGSRLGKQVRITCANAKLSSDVFQRATPSDRVRAAI